MALMILFLMSLFKFLLNNSFLWLKAFLAIPILVLISVSHLPSLVMRAPRYMYLNRSTCSSLSPSIVMFIMPSPFLDTFMTFVFFIFTFMSYSFAVLIIIFIRCFTVRFRHSGLNSSPGSLLTRTRMGLGANRQKVLSTLRIIFSHILQFQLALGGQPEHGHVPPKIEKHPCISHFLPSFAPQKFFGFAHPIFLTSLSQCQLVYYLWTLVISRIHECFVGPQTELQAPATHC